MPRNYIIKTAKLDQIVMYKVMELCIGIWNIFKQTGIATEAEYVNEAAARFLE